MMKVVVDAAAADDDDERRKEQEDREKSTAPVTWIGKVAASFLADLSDHRRSPPPRLRDEAAIAEPSVPCVSVIGMQIGPSRRQKQQTLPRDAPWLC